MPRPIAILTDFGYQDAYAGVMKGVLLSRCPGAQVLDLTHGIPPQDILAGALYLASAAPYCPADAVFLAVVDPGVGSERRALAIKSGGRWFVGPDNGLLWPAAAALGTPRVYHLDRPECWLPRPGATFHGRDVFAPIAALLSLGRAPADVGTPIEDPVRLEVPAPRPLPDGVGGEVLLVDHYGNAVTTLRPSDLGDPPPGSRLFEVAGRALRGPATHYGSVPAGEPLVLLGSLGYYEVAVNGGSAADTLDLQRGDRVLSRTQNAT